MINNAVWKPISGYEELYLVSNEGQVFSLESTTYPGTTEEELLPRIQESGLKAGENIFLIYSAEREDPGNPDFVTRTIPKVVGGHTPSCLKVGIAL